MSDFAERDALLGRNARRYKCLSVGDWDVRIRSLNGLEYAEVESLITQSAIAKRKTNPAEKLALANAKVIQLSVCDGDGNLTFESGDLSQICLMDNSILAALVDGCMSHSGIDGANLEVMAKNSSETTGGSSPTDSPSSSATQT